ncbi:MAG: SDR family oxidoreductase [Alphaproteobacteria bacterium]|nr:SDR family oxidoreductase [Alphaproteobacteria bacterium]
MQAARLFDVSGTVSLVTGAASGLGLAMAEVMAENGARVAMLDVDAGGLETHLARLSKTGAAVEGHVVDVTDGALLKRTIGDVATKHGRLDSVFANAGISAGPGFESEVGHLEAVDRERWDRVLRINLTSVFETLQAAAGPMKRQKSGRIVVTSSIAGIGAEAPCGYAYVATKAAVANLVRQAALELARYNVLVNAIAPGPFRTNIGGGQFAKRPDSEAMWAARTALGRVADPAELKGLALFLASPASSYVTGTVIPIDGGATAD